MLVEGTNTQFPGLAPGNICLVCANLKGEVSMVIVCHSSHVRMLEVSL